MSDAEIQGMVKYARAYQLDCLKADLCRCLLWGQTWPLRWIGPGLVDRAWEILEP